MLRWCLREGLKPSRSYRAIRLCRAVGIGARSRVRPVVVRQPGHSNMFPDTALPVELGPPRVLDASWPRDVSIRRAWCLKPR